MNKIELSFKQLVGVSLGIIAFSTSLSFFVLRYVTNPIDNKLLSLTKQEVEMLKMQVENNKNELNSTKNDVDSTKRNVDSTLRDVAVLTSKTHELKVDVERLTTEEIVQKLNKIDGQINSISSQLDSLQQIISPNGATEILTVAKMKDEILKRGEFEGKLKERTDGFEKKSDEKLKNFQEQTNRIDDRLDSLRNWMLGVLVTLITGLIAIVWYLIKRVGQMTILLQEVSESTSSSSGNETPSATS